MSYYDHPRYPGKEGVSNNGFSERIQSMVQDRMRVQALPTEELVGVDDPAYTKELWRRLRPLHELGDGLVPIPGLVHHRDHDIHDTNGIVYIGDYPCEYGLGEVVETVVPASPSTGEGYYVYQAKCPSCGGVADSWRPGEKRGPIPLENPTEE